MRIESDRRAKTGACRPQPCSSMTSPSSTRWSRSTCQRRGFDTLPRTLTDILWTSNKWVRDWCKGDVRKLYYSTLAAFVGWGCIGIMELTGRHGHFAHLHIGTHGVVR